MSCEDCERIKAEVDELKLADRNGEIAHKYIQQLEQKVATLAASLQALTEERDVFKQRLQGWHDVDAEQKRELDANILELEAQLLAQSARLRACEEKLKAEQDYLQMREQELLTEVQSEELAGNVWKEARALSALVEVQLAQHAIEAQATPGERGETK